MSQAQRNNATIRAPFEAADRGDPDTRPTLHDLIAEGDRVVVRRKVASRSV